MSQPGLRIRRYLIWTLISLVMLLLVAATTVSTILATEGGSRWAIRYALAELEKMEGFSSSFGASRGNMLQGLQLEGLRIDSAGLVFSAQRLDLLWDPWPLFAGQLRLAELTAAGLELQLPAGEEAVSVEPSPFVFAPLPVSIVIDDLNLSDARVILPAQTLTLQRLVTSLSLTGTTLEADELELRAEPVRIEGDLALELADRLPVQATLRWQYNDALPLGWQRAAGQLQIAGSLQSLQIDSQITTPVNLRSRGVVSELDRSEQLALDLSHSGEDLDLMLGEQLYSFPRFAISTVGTLDSLELVADLSVQAAGFAPAELNAQAQLSGSQLRLQQADLDTGAGNLRLVGELDWAAGLRASASASLQDVEPARLLAQEALSAFTDVDADLTLRFARNEEDGLSLELQLSELSSLASGYPLRGSGAVSLREGRLRIDQLQLDSSANSLLIDGEIVDSRLAGAALAPGAESLAIEWQLQAQDLAQLLPELDGSVQGLGSLGGSLSSPLVNGTLQASDLTVRLENTAAALAALDVTVTGNAQNSQLRLRGQELTVDLGGSRQRIDAIEVDFDGNLQSHRLAARAQGEPGRLQLSLDGGVPDATDGRWQGELQQASVTGLPGNWRLQAPVQLALADGMLSSSESCWLMDPLRLCLQLENRGADYGVSGLLERFPLAALNRERPAELNAFPLLPELPIGVSAAGEAGGRFEAALASGALQSLQFELSSQQPVLGLSSTGEDEFGSDLSSDEIVRQFYTWESIELSGRLDNETWRFTADAGLAERNIRDSELDLDGNFQAQLEIAADGALSGQAEAAFDDLGWIAAFTQDLSEVAGRLDASVDIAGSLSEPVLTGSVNLSEGSASVPRLGVQYTALDLRLQSLDANTARLDGSISTGPGYLTVTGDARNLGNADWEVVTQIQGEDFNLTALPDLVMEVSPAVALRLDANLIDIEGLLRVPVLVMNLRQLPTSAVDISSDVIVVSFPEDRPELARSYTAGQTAVFDIPLAADLTLELGENVRFSGFGLQARLAGELEFEQFANGSNLTYGELEVVQGSYGLYGHTLDLRQGRLLFLGNYNNPALDVRAVREVENITVGVLMNGTLRNIRSQLFSTPTLPDSDIISVMVTGRRVAELGSGGPADSAAVLGAIAQLGLEQGEGLTQDIGDRLGLDTLAITTSGDIDTSELTVGKYLTPDLFIRYAIGLFDQRGRLAVDYRLSERLLLQAESGEAQSLDITYKVER